MTVDVTGIDESDVRLPDTVITEDYCITALPKISGVKWWWLACILQLSSSCRDYHIHMKTLLENLAAVLHTCYFWKSVQIIRDTRRTPGPMCFPYVVAVPVNTKVV